LLSAHATPRFEYLLDVWQELMGGQHRPKPSSQTKTKNHLNYALAYMMVHGVERVGRTNPH